MQNVQKWVSFIFLATGVLTWWVLRQISEFVVALLPWRVATDWTVPLHDWVGMGVGLLLFILLRRSAVATGFMAEVIGEISKVTWPARKETILSTGVVAIMVAIAALILFGFDTLWGTV